MFLKEDGSAKILHLTQASFPTKIYMNLYKHHLREGATKVSTKMSHHLRHQSKCDGTVKYVFPGVVYKNKLSVFEELEKTGVRVREEDKYKKMVSVFRFRGVPA